MSDGFNTSYPVFSKSSAHPRPRSDYYLNLDPDVVGPGFSGPSHEDKIALFSKILALGIHGISYSPYLDGQSPGTEIPAEQIRQRIRIIQPYTRWIRTFSCIEGHQEAPRIGRELGAEIGNAIGYSGYRERQSPLDGRYPSYAQVVEDLKLLDHEWRYLRVYDCSRHADLVLEAIRSEWDAEVMPSAGGTTDLMTDTSRDVGRCIA